MVSFHGLLLAFVLVVLACLFHDTQSSDVCIDGGKTYKAGESFVDEKCTGQCKCHSGGTVSCVSLCPPVNVVCAPGERFEKKVAVAGGRCSCAIPFCGKACHVDGQMYQLGQQFIDNKCTAQCTCNKEGHVSCVSLCPPLNVACAPGETVKQKEIPVTGSDDRCFCKIPYCQKACQIDGQTYQPGQQFTNKHCTAQCTCHEGGLVSCVSLCPPSRVICPEGKTESTKQVPAGSDERCHCNVPTCI